MIKQEKIKALAKYLKANTESIIQFDNRECYFEINKSHPIIKSDTYTEGWCVYTKEEREKYAREYLKDMIKDECYNHYIHLELTTGMNKEELMNLFKPEDKEKTCTLENVYDFLVERNELDKYIEVILTDESFDHYKEQLSPCCFEGGEQYGYYMYQWC